MSVSATSKVPSFSLWMPQTPSFRALNAAGYRNVEAVARGQMKPEPGQPNIGGLAENALNMGLDGHLGLREIGTFASGIENLRAGGTFLGGMENPANAAYQGAACSGIFINGILATDGFITANQKIKIADRIGDKIGSLEGRISKVKYAVLFTSSISYSFTRVLNILSEALHFKIGHDAPTLLGRVAFGFGIASTLLILIYTVGVAVFAVRRIYQRNTFLSKFDNARIFGGKYARTTNDKINYLRKRLLVFGDVDIALQQAIANPLWLDAHGGPAILPVGTPTQQEIYDISSATGKRSLEKYDRFSANPENLIALGKTWARENLKAAIESFPEQFAEIKQATDEELDELIHHFLSLKATAEGRVLTEQESGTYYAELGKLAFFTHLEQKKDAKMSRILGMNQIELQNLKRDLANPHLSQARKIEISDDIHNRISKSNRFDYVLTAIMILGIIALIVAMTCTAGIGPIIATALFLAFSIACLAIDGKGFYDAYHAKDVGKRDELMAKIAIVIGFISFAVSLTVLFTVSFGIIPLVTVSILFVAWTAFKVTTWYLARKIRLEKEAAAAIHGPPLAHRGVAQITPEAQRDVYNLYMRHKHHHTI